jgi:hypothetical protein
MSDMSGALDYDRIIMPYMPIHTALVAPSGRKAEVVPPHSFMHRHVYDLGLSVSGEQTEIKET